MQKPFMDTFSARNFNNIMCFYIILVVNEVNIHSCSLVIRYNYHHLTLQANITSRSTVYRLLL